MRKRKLGIIIPTKNRLDYLSRILFLYSRHPLFDNINFFIADASNLETNILLKKNVSSLNSKNISILHLPRLTIGQSIKKIAEIAHIKCSYLTMHGDDDFMFIDTLIEMVDILENNKNLRSIQGYAITSQLRPIANQRFRIGAFGDYWEEPKRLERTIFERLVAHSQKYYVANFSLRNSADYYKSVSELPSRLTIKSNIWQEYFESYSVVAIGKSFFLPKPFLVRGIHKQRISLKKLKDNELEDFNLGRLQFCAYLKGQFSKVKGKQKSEIQALEIVNSLFLKIQNKQVKKYKLDLKKHLPFKIRFFLSKLNHDKKYVYETLRKFQSEMNR